MDPPTPVRSVHAVELDGELVLLRPDTQRVSHLDPLASLIWPFLTGDVTVGELSSDLSDVFGVDAKEIRRDVDAMLQTLWELGFLEPTVEQAAKPGVGGPFVLSDPPSP